MFRLARHSRPFALVLLFVLTPFTSAFAHCFVGARFFPATLTIDDPCVADELSLPTVAWSRTGDQPPGEQWDVSGELSKRLTETIGLSIGEEWSQIRGPGMTTAAGFGDLETTLQYQLFKDPTHETAMLLGVSVDWGGTGATSAGFGTSYSVITPTYYFGQGFGSFRTPSAGCGRRRSPVRSATRFRPVPMTPPRRSTFRSHWSTAHRCNTACRILNRR